LGQCKFKQKNIGFAPSAAHPQDENAMEVSVPFCRESYPVSKTSKWSVLATPIDELGAHCRHRDAPTTLLANGTLASNWPNSATLRQATLPR
jgi:hypothetical protein